MTSGFPPLLPFDQYIASLARKRMAAGSLFRDEDGRVLLVDPTYKPMWDLPGGVVEALDEARKQGKTRYVGFTGHTSPKFHLAMLARGYHFDAVLMPMNAFEAARRGFRIEVLPELNRQGIAALGMALFGFILRPWPMPTGTVRPRRRVKLS